MKKGKLLLVWLSSKVAIISLLFVLLGCNCLLSAVFKEFWYKINFSLIDVRRKTRDIPSVDQFSDTGLNALMMASDAGRKEIVDYLIEQGSNVNLLANNPLGNTALHFAIANGKVPVFKSLLMRNAHPAKYNKNQDAPIHFTVKCERDIDFRNMVHKLVDMGVNINLPDKEKRSLLFWAIDENKEKRLAFLQENFAHLLDYNMKDSSGSNAVEFAKSKGDVVKYVKPVVLESLHAGIDVNAFEAKFSFNNNFNLIMTAAVKGQNSYLQDIIKNKKPNLNLKDRRVGNTALHWALFYNRPNVVETLASNKANVMSKNKAGLQPIHCLWGIREKSDRKKVAKLLFKYGADFNAKDPRGNNFLQRAVLWSDTDLVKLATKDNYFTQRINFNAKNKRGKTVFDIAQKIKNKKMIDMLKPLKKIVISKADKKKKITPLMVAAMRGDLETVKALLKDKTKANINAKTKKKDTALHYAVRFRNKNIALLLIQMGAKVDIKNSKKETPLHEVVNVFDQEDRRELTRALFAKGADIAENNKGETVMHLAVRKNMPEFILFLKENIGQMAKNKKGQTPLDVAKELGKTKDMGAVIDLLSGKK